MSLEFIQLQSYTAPSIIEQKNKDWVQYGDDNNYYQYLIDLYHGSPNKIPVGESVVPQYDERGNNDYVHATEDITYASDFGEHVHKVVPHDWSEIEPWEHDEDTDAFPDLIKPDGSVMQSFDSKKGFKVIGYVDGMGWKPGVKHPERKL